MREYSAVLTVLMTLLLFAGATSATEPHLRIDLSQVDPAEESHGDPDLRHLRWVLTEEQIAEYRAGDLAARREMMRLLWASLDPTPTTPQCERKDQHYRRLAWARRHFAAPDDPGWDGRGELLIRYGPPDFRTESVGDGVRVPPSETWIYDGLQLAFNLDDPKLKNQYAVNVGVGHDPGTRFDKAFEYDIASGSRFQPWTYSLDGARLMGRPLVDFEALMKADQFNTLLENGREVLQHHPQIYVHDYGGEVLDVALDATSFAARDGRTRLEVHTAYRAQDLEYAREDDAWVALLDVEAVAKTPDFREVAKAARLTRDTKDSVENLEGRLVLDQIALTLDPGSYLLALSVRDSLSRRIGVFERPVEVLSFPAGQVSISDVQLAFSVKPGRPDDPFLKGDVQVAPCPFDAYPRTRDLYLYFEIYGLEQSPTGDTHYSVDFFLQPREGKKGSWFGSSRGRVEPGVATSWDGRSRGFVAREHVALDTATLEPGTYDVMITARDRVGEGTAERPGSFTIGK